jgi:NAD(P)-dependent dehydrogenase (short-subunit alcohol dehydrogenase family)
MVLDVTDKPAVREAFAEAVRNSGRLDICFANAGIAEPGLPLRFEDYSDTLWQRLLDVNLSGVWNTDSAAAEIMRRQKSGVIVNTASIVGIVADGQYGCIGYTAAKGGVVQLTRQLAVMLARDGVRVNAIAPGYVATGLSDAEQLDHPDPEIRRLQAEVLARTPMGRFAAPAELGGIAIFLASEAASYCTGATFPVDGGWLAA